jgi:hypothetical protein
MCRAVRMSDNVLLDSRTAGFTTVAKRRQRKPTELGRALKQN